MTALPGESTSAQARRFERERDNVVREAQDLSAALTRTQQALAASQADLSRVEGERDMANELTDKIAAELRGVTRERDALARRCAVRFEETQALRAELATVDEAAGRDIAAPDEPLVDRVADLRRGRAEATQRALELAAELATARAELERLRTPPHLTEGAHR